MSDTHLNPHPVRPNLIFVFPDQMRRAAQGYIDEDPVKTPHLDCFAKESLHLINATSTFPVCTPFRGMLMTGKYPLSTGITGNCNSSRPDVFLRESEICFSDVLSSAGYRCGYIGKWHLDRPEPPNLCPPIGGITWDAYTPPGRARHGFEYWHAYGTFDDHFHPHYWVDDAKFEEKIEINEWSPRYETNVAIEFLKKSASKPERPFAMFLSYNPPHTPYELVPDEYAEPYRKQEVSDLLNRPNLSLKGKGEKAALSVQNYFGMVTGIDEQFGRLLKAVDELNLKENTIVVFVSDHGEMMGSHDLMFKSCPYEEAFRIPFLLRWPAKVPVREEAWSMDTPDLMPTLLGLMGLGEKIPTTVQGRDLSAAILDSSAAGREAALYLNHTTGACGLRTATHLFLLGEPSQGYVPCLFDHRVDPFQMENVASKNPQLVQEMTAALKSRLREISYPNPIEGKPPIPVFNNQWA